MLHVQVSAYVLLWGQWVDFVLYLEKGIIRGVLLSYAKKNSLTDWTALQLFMYKLLERHKNNIYSTHM